MDMRIAECTTLPSLGKLYDEEIDESVTVGSMRAKHETMRLSAMGDGANKIMSEIIDDCSNLPKGLSSYDMTLGDFQYLLYRLRMATYGPDYEINSGCPRCGYEHSTPINMDDLEIRYFDDEMIPLFDVELPVSKHKVKLTLQTPRMLDTVNKNARTFMRKHAGASNPTLIYSIVDSIIEWDDEPVNVFDKIKIQKVIEELPMRDVNVLMNRIDELNGYIGVNTDIEITCPICGNVYVVPFQVSQKFWRPD